MEETVGARIERLAAAKGLPANAALAELFGVTYETLRKWRAGQTAPSRKRAAKISEKLGVEPEVFMHGVAQATITPAAPLQQPGLSVEAQKIGRWYDSMSPDEQQKARLMMWVVKPGVNPTNFPAPGPDHVDEPDSGLSNLDQPHGPKKR